LFISQGVGLIETTLRSSGVECVLGDSRNASSQAPCEGIRTMLNAPPTRGVKGPREAL